MARRKRRHGWVFPVPSMRWRKLMDSFGRTFIPGTSRRYARGFHGATDIVASDGATARVVRSARVVYAGVIPGLEALGQQLLVRYRVRGGHRYVRYCHMRSIKARYRKQGAPCARGARFGRVGSTGQTSGPHIHFEWSKSPRWSDGEALMNPYRMLEAARRP